jgi:hypothetical protein
MRWNEVLGEPMGFKASEKENLQNEEEFTLNSALLYKPSDVEIEEIQKASMLL